MENTHEDTYLIDTQEQDIENNEVEQEEFHENTNDDLITEEEIKCIHPDLDQKFPSTKSCWNLLSIDSRLNIINPSTNIILPPNE